ncbi:hypothetical protein [Stenotrophomonas maltophilia]|uniref:hypothetical protein n=1 Tax=Stenotrophomonas maltophilia TaxID=40324 RepID=UPI0034E1C695
MIDASFLENVVTMDDRQFSDLADAGEKFVLVNVVPIEGSTEWAIFGPYGVYVSPAGNRTFAHLAAAHAQLAQWKIKKFFQVGQLKVFPGAQLS